MARFNPTTLTRQLFLTCFNCWHYHLNLELFSSKSCFQTSALQTHILCPPLPLCHPCLSEGFWSFLLFVFIASVYSVPRLEECKLCQAVYINGICTLSRNKANVDKMFFSVKSLKQVCDKSHDLDLTRGVFV